MPIPWKHPTGGLRCIFKMLCQQMQAVSDSARMILFLSGGTEPETASDFMPWKGQSCRLNIIIILCRKTAGQAKRIKD